MRLERFSNLIDFVKSFELEIRNEFGIDSIIEDYSNLLNFDVIVHDENGEIISGTGRYKNRFGSGGKNSLVQKVLKSLEPYIVYDSKKSELGCSNCSFNDSCVGYGSITYPILNNQHKAIGVISIIGFSNEHKEEVKMNTEFYLQKLFNFSIEMEKKLRALQLPNQNRLIDNETINFRSIIGNDNGLINLINKAKKVSNSPSTVLIRGESGTGKELIARAIHNESFRNSKQFVAINCAAIPETLLESELFGYEGGSFTGSKKEGSKGKFELADGGTIFLDEIGDMPLSLQPKLLRVLQERKIERIGGKKSIPIDVRVIAATHRNLESMLQDGSFREDLYYRLNVIPLYTMPLRDRQSDIELFCNYFIHKHCKLLNKEIMTLNADLAKWLIQYSWPGNIRQLENAIEYMVNMAESPVIGFHDLPDYLKQSAGPENTGLSLEQMISQYERKILESYFVLEDYKHDKSKVAEELKISLATLYRKLDKYNFCEDDK
ncbi:sigma-54 interaction domain-containing protein [Lysinibacillus fusiformis]|uniref:sigma-54 interaction domain-containing protein n=1 Tax=Lysinibacillus sp. PWR01 TaxID=3342384 RepID=UPI00372CEED6